MALEDYYADFEKYFWHCGDLRFWKLERQQTFKEPGYDSWEAFWRGDWDESLRLLETGRADMAEYHRKVEQHGFVARRARVVEEPLSDYMQWELRALRIRDQCGAPSMSPTRSGWPNTSKTARCPRSPLSETR
ncbi:DUF6879 family protein [Streptomyces turgidiscabies]|uniref:DUF6879 domain-containing protein n=1 Tax=Streptomyces turgidiscabies TaxID=85558 RepID=A0ABU0RQ56_9ACTN|nr:DUF6879 family protein [Streptomyces turgidiscabies]MDQ0934094.1 hypothetical protein [Streptomyces turgidiscabies]